MIFLTILYSCPFHKYISFFFFSLCNVFNDHCYKVLWDICKPSLIYQSHVLQKDSEREVFSVEAVLFSIVLYQLGRWSPTRIIQGAPGSEACQWDPEIGRSDGNRWKRAKKGSQKIPKREALGPVWLGCLWSQQYFIYAVFVYLYFLYFCIWPMGI